MTGKMKLQIDTILKWNLVVLGNDNFSLISHDCDDYMRNDDGD